MEIIKTLDILETHIGLRVNYEKSSVHCIGNAKKFHIERPIVWNPGGLSVLSHNVNNDCKSNYEILLKKSENVLNLWRHRQLSLLGKILVVNSLVSSLFVYTMQVELDPPKEIIERFKQIVQKYLWSGKRAKIKLDTLQAATENGGCRLTNLLLKNQAIKAAWILRNNEYCCDQKMLIAPKGLGELILVM